MANVPILVIGINNLPEALQSTDTPIGAVSSVGLSLPSGYSVTNSPITTSGTIVATTTSTPDANTVLAMRHFT